MHRLTGPSATRLRRYSWLFMPGLIVVLLSLFVSLFSDVGSRAHAATQSSLSSTRKTEFVHHRPDGYHANGLMSLIGQTANLSRIDRSNSKQPALMLTRTNSPDTVTHGKHGIAYVLSVSNGHFAGPVAAGNTIIVSNVIPSGVTGVTTHAKECEVGIEGRPNDPHGNLCGAVSCACRCQPFADYRTWLVGASFQPSSPSSSGCASFAFQ